MSTPNYHAMHERIRRTRGPASALPCASCANPADEWAYDNLDPNEVSGVAKNGTPVRYSASLDHYVPMCRSCHRRLDSGNRRKTECAHGHEFNAENTYTWRNQRCCRTCRAEYHRARRARKKAEAA